MADVIVYGDPSSTCTQRVLIVLEELGIEYDLHKVDLMLQENKETEYLKLQPFQKVPFVKYFERDLFESRAILRYIARVNKEIVNLAGDVNCDVWLEVESNNYNGPVSKIIYEKVFKKWLGSDEETNESIVESSIEDLEKVLDVYETRLREHRYIGGDDYSIADIAHIPYTYLMLKNGYKHLYKSRPHVYEWLKDIMRRPAVKRVLSQS